MLYIPNPRAGPFRRERPLEHVGPHVIGHDLHCALRSKYGLRTRSYRWWQSQYGLLPKPKLADLAGLRQPVNRCRNAPRRTGQPPARRQPSALGAQGRP
jgi:hypothetical protein